MKCPKCETVNPADAKFCKECATPLPSGARGQASFTRTLETTSGDLARGTVFAGRYEIIEELGAGGMGKVYRALDKKLDEEVALKFVKPEIAADKRTVERFRNELKIARRIRHKNVCGMYDFHEAGQTLYLTMEYVRGEDLKSLIHRTKTLSVGAAVGIARQVAEGLGEAHKLGITHRDLKPGNVMIDKDGQAKIMDFGIARSLAGGGITAEGGIIGTPEYMSPEQVEGKPADPRADLYALGVILFEMVTGQVPFEGETPFSIANKHKSEPPPVPRRVAPQVPEGLSKLILRCLEKDRAKRYQTAEALIADLAVIEGSLPATERVSAGRTASKAKPTLSKKVTVEFTPRRVLVPAAAILVLAGAFLLWRFVMSPPSPPPVSARPALAILNFENISKNPGLEQWKAGLPLLLRYQLGQSRFLKLQDEGSVLGALKKLDLRQTEKLTADEYKAVAAESGATHLISGSYLDAGGKFFISLSLIDGRTGSLIKPLQEEAPNTDAVQSSIDSVVKKIKAALNIDEPAVDESVFRGAGEVFTTSREALREFFVAAGARQTGDLAAAAKALEQAVEYDPGFALAYRDLSGVYAGLGQYAKRYESMRKAYERKDRLPEEDRLAVETSWLCLTEEGLPKAHEICHKFVERYPENSYARYTLAWSAPDIDETTKEYENLLFVRKNRSNAAYNMLAQGLCRIGDYRRAREDWSRSLADFPEDVWRHGILGQLLIFEGRPEAALSEYEKSAAGASRFDVQIMRSFYYYEIGDVKKAVEIAENLRRTEKDLSAADGWFSTLALTGGKFLEGLDLNEKWEGPAVAAERGNIDRMTELRIKAGMSHLEAGRPDRALEKFDAALAAVAQEEAKVPGLILYHLIHDRRTAMIWQACALCELSRIEEAEALYRKIESLIPDHLKKAKDQHRPLCFCVNTEFIAGKIALARRDLPTAIQNLEKSLELLGNEGFWVDPDHAYILDLLAGAYRSHGELEKSALALARISALSTGRSNWAATYGRSFYKLGQVYEQMNKKAEAREKYTKFLTLWKDADPGLPEVEDAKKRLAALI